MTEPLSLPYCEKSPFNERSFLYQAFYNHPDFKLESKYCNDQNKYERISLIIAVTLRLLSLIVACFQIAKLRNSQFFITPVLRTTQLLFSLSIIVSGLVYFIYLAYIFEEDFYSIEYVSSINDRFISNKMYNFLAVVSTFCDLIFFFFFIVNSVEIFKYINCCEVRVAERYENIENRAHYNDRVCRNKCTRCEMTKILISIFIPIIVSLLLACSPFINNKNTKNDNIKIKFYNGRDFEIPFWPDTDKKKFNENTQTCIDNGNIFSKLISCEIDNCYKSLCIFLFENDYSDSNKDNSLNKYGFAKGYEFSTLYPIPLPVDDFFIRLFTYDIWFILSAVAAFFIFVGSIRTYRNRHAEERVIWYQLRRHCLYLLIITGAYILIVIFNVLTRLLAWIWANEGRHYFYTFLKDKYNNNNNLSNEINISNEAKNSWKEFLKRLFPKWILFPYGFFNPSVISIISSFLYIYFNINDYTCSKHRGYQNINNYNDNNDNNI